MCSLKCYIRVESPAIVPPSTPATSLAFGTAFGAALLGAALILPSCGQILGVSSWVDVGGSTDAAADGSALDATGLGDGALLDGGAEGSTTGPCASPVDGGSAGVLVDEGGSFPFCIDATETTVALYAVFLSDPTLNPAQGQPPECGWNTTYKPFYNAYMGDPQALQRPVTSIDWCDATAFCAYWGKHLCGNRLDAGPVDPTAALPQSEWYYACAGAEGSSYPYGNTYDPARCRTNLPLEAGAGIVPTTTCVGNVAGLYDMSGNLAEWENSCTPSGMGDAGDDPCMTRGGTFFFMPDAVTCDGRTGGALNPRNGSDTAAVTIRCCWEP
jgi:formylglycine-generating enzyme